MKKCAIIDMMQRGANMHSTISISDSDFDFMKLINGSIEILPTQKKNIASPNII